MEMKSRVTIGGLWKSLYPVLLYMAIQFIVGIFYSIGLSVYAAYRGTDFADLSDYMMDRIAVGTVIIVLLAALVTIPIYWWLYCRDIQWKLKAGLEDYFPLTEWLLLWSVLGCGALALLGNGLISLLPLAKWSESYEEVSDALYTGSIWLRMVSIGIFGPVVEELSMRGLMYQRFRSELRLRPAAAVFWSALVFGIFHGNVIQGIYAFLIGLYFAWLMERTQQILVPIVGHMSANLLVVLLEETNAMEWIYGSMQNFLLSMLFCAIVFGCSVQGIRNARDRKSVV